MADVVSLERKGKTALIIMHDEANGNMFTDDLVNGLKAHLQTVAADPNINVVVLTGRGPYFSCGGTREDLLAILDGKIEFTAKGMHDLLIKHPLPVINAVQGHAMGGGLSFACSGDLAIFGRENVYSASFMKYGFTPGMGSTHYVPAMLGEKLASEMLYTAHTYRGQDLIDRGAPVVVVPKKDVVEAALAKAAHMGDKERNALMLLKNHLTQDAIVRLETVIQRELAMHEKTFRQQSALVKERILQRFGA